MDLSTRLSIVALSAFCVSGCGSDDLTCNSDKVISSLKSNYQNILGKSGIYTPFFVIDESDLEASSFSKIGSDTNRLSCAAQVKFNIVFSSAAKDAIAHGATIGPQLTQIKEKLSEERTVTYSVRKADDGKIFTKFDEGGP